MLRLLTFGGLGLVNDDGSVAPRVRPPRLALLAALAVADDRGVSRERLLALFWPESDEARGRHSLRQALYVLRHEIGRDVVVSRETSLSLDASVITSDVAEFRLALGRDDRVSAVKLAPKPFLDGFYLPNTPEFERWIEHERARFTAAVSGALLVLARTASAVGDRRAAVEWWRQLVALDPLSSHAAVGYVQALAADGDRARALAFVRQHEALVRRELEAEPDAEVRRLEASLRAEVSVDIPFPELRRPSGAPPAAPALPNDVTAAADSDPGTSSAFRRRGSGVRRLLWGLGASGLLALGTTAALTRERGWLDATDRERTDVSDAARDAGAGAAVATATTSSSVAARLYEEGLRAYSRFDVEAAHQLMHAALQEDSSFAMAAYYEAKLATDPQGLFDGRSMGEVRSRALRLAERAPEHERLTITADLLSDNNEPQALAVAESLVARYPNDARALGALGRIRAHSGDWPGAAEATERAIRLDSAAGGPRMPLETNCRFCQDMALLMDIYFASDSLAAVERVAHRFARAYPTSHQAYYVLAIAAARRGDSTAAHAWYQRMTATGSNPVLRMRLRLALEDYDAVERDARQFLASSHRHEWQQGIWNYLIALRNQGRLKEAMRLHRTGQLPGMASPTVERGYDGYNEAILAFDRGDGRLSAAVFEANVRANTWPSPGLRARHRTWHATLQGMALAAVGDTVGVRLLVDSVAAWGRSSLFGRDRHLHHYLRGLLLAAAGRCDEATREYRAAIVSPSLGFTRVNYELGQCLLGLGRPREAIAALQPALRGEVDAANLYVTRTDLHELLARAFDATGVGDSAAFHYRAVVKAWSRADPMFHGRRAAAERRLARLVAPPVRVGGDR